MGIDRALGQAGRSRGVGDHHRLERRLDERAVAAMPGDHLLVIRRESVAGAEADERQAMFPQRGEEVPALALHEEEARLGIGDKGGDLGRGEARVEPDAHRADLGAGDEGLRHLDAVGRQDRDAVAGRNPEGAQPMAERVGALIERAPGDAAVELDEGVLAAPGQAVAPRELAEG